MIVRAHEKPAFHEFLFSKRREQIIDPVVYKSILDYYLQAEPDQINILDFGCGNGYVSLLLADHAKNLESLHIYSLDYQEELLDTLWKRIVQKGLKNITPFHLNEQNRIFYPNWLPPMDLVFFSFSLSAASGPDDILKTTLPIIRPGGKVFIMDWGVSVNDEVLDELFSRENRLTPMILEQILERSGYYLESVQGKYRFPSQDGYFFLEGTRPLL